MNEQVAVPLQLFICEDPAVMDNVRPATPEQVIEAAKHQAAAYLANRPLTVDSPFSARDFLLIHFAGKEREIFTCLFLDTKHFRIAVVDLFLGTINEAAIYPREVVKAALKHNAAAVILAHNHPSGSTKPSQADMAITERLREALNLVDIRLLDHFVIGGSLVERIEIAGLRPARKKFDPEKCAICGKPITQPKRGRRIFCSPECRRRRAETW